MYTDRQTDIERVWRESRRKRDDCAKKRMVSGKVGVHQECLLPRRRSRGGGRVIASLEQTSSSSQTFLAPIVWLSRGKQACGKNFVSVQRVYVKELK